MKHWQSENLQVDWRLFRLYQQQQSAELPRGRPTTRYQPFRPVSLPSHPSCCIVLMSRCRAVFLLGYLPTHNRLFVTDKDMNISSYALALTVIEYQTAILRGDMQAAEEMLPTIPPDQRNRIARFLEAQGGSSLLSPSSCPHMPVPTHLL